MEKPLVSICCITYNHEEYIGDAIEGFLMQEVDFPVEIIIHDDASTDNTQEIIKEYAQKDNRIIPILREENIKSTGAHVFPFTYERAKGKYIALCEGDDYWTVPQKLQKQVNFLEENEEAVMVAHQTQRIDEDGTQLDIFPERQPKFLKPAKVVIKGGGYFATNSIMFRSEIMKIEIPKWFYEFPAGDTALSYWANEQGKIGFINEVMGAYRKNVPGSWTSRQEMSGKIRRLSKVIKCNQKILRVSRYKWVFIFKQIETFKRITVSWILGLIKR